MRPARIASIPLAVRRAIAAQARREAPKECCGFLIGRNRRVDFAVPMPNVDPRPRTGFRIDPAEHIAARRVLRRLVPALEIVGVYHSHPRGPATPSPRDLAEAHYPDWLFAIVSNRTVRVFQIRAGVATVVPVRWRQSAPRTYAP